MDTTSLRLLIKLAAQRRWSLGKLDIKTAFLNAPLHNYTVVVRPPQLAILLGLAEAGGLWLLLRTLYGLRVAPKAWEEERDKQLREAKWSKGLKKYKFKQLLSEASLWLVLGDDHLVAMIGIYVDDIIAAGPRKIVDEVLDLFGTIWAASETEVLQLGAAVRKFISLVCALYRSSVAITSTSACTLRIC